jgi:hypothetical protein
MKILQIFKNIVISCLLLSAQRIGAQAPSSNRVYPIVPYGVQPIPPIPPDPVKFLFYQTMIPIAGLIIILSAVLSPIIGYRWYIKHGGSKKWLKWFTYLPLVVVIMALLILLFWPRQ